MSIQTDCARKPAEHAWIGPGLLRAHPDKVRGEMTLVVGGAAEQTLEEADADRLLGPLLAELPLAQAVRIAASQSSMAHRFLYGRALALTSGRDPV